MTGQLTGRVVKAALFPHARLEFAHELAAVLARRVQLFHEFLLADHKIKLDAFDLVKGLANAGGQACGGHRKRLRGIARARTHPDRGLVGFDHPARVVGQARKTHRELIKGFGVKLRAARNQNEGKVGAVRTYLGKAAADQTGAVLCLAVGVKKRQSRRVPRTAELAARFVLKNQTGVRFGRGQFRAGRFNRAGAFFKERAQALNAGFKKAHCCEFSRA